MLFWSRYKEQTEMPRKKQPDRILMTVRVRNDLAAWLKRQADDVDGSVSRQVERAIRERRERLDKLQGALEERA
jgi:hypothetical protein